MGRDGKVSVPRGLTLRDTSEGVRIQVSFVWQGKQCRELLPPGKLTKSYIEYATGLRAEIKRRLADGTFNYASYFPNSPRVQESAPVVAPLTLGSLLVRQLRT
jgi:integrase